MSDGRLIPEGIHDERTLALAEIIDRLGALDLDVLQVLDVANVEASALPHLADQFGIIGYAWQLATTDEQRRELILLAIQLHRHKGTPWAIKEACRVVGFPVVSIVEGVSGHWARFRVVIDVGARTVSAAEGKLLQQAVAQQKNVRSWLDDLIIDTGAFADAAVPAADELGTVALDAAFNDGVTTPTITVAPISYDGANLYDGSAHYGQFDADQMSFGVSVPLAEAATAADAPMWITQTWHTQYNGQRTFNSDALYGGDELLTA